MSHRSEEAQIPGCSSRRDFLRTAMLTGATAAVAGVSAHAFSGAKHHAKALLLSCMDFRLIQELEAYMESRGLVHNYDDLILAGASLAVTSGKRPAWAQTFWDHLELSIQLHEIENVIVIDHRDCGAYKLLLGEDFSRDRARETGAHTDQLHEFRKEVKAKYPALEVETLLMGLDGKVEAIA